MHISLTLKQGFWSRTEYCDYRNRHQVKKFELYGFFEHRWKTHASNRNIIFEYCKNYFLIRWMFRFNLCTSYLFLCCHVKIPTQRENAYDRLGHRIIIITLVVNPDCCGRLLLICRWLCFSHCKNQPINTECTKIMYYKKLFFTGLDGRGHF